MDSLHDANIKDSDNLTRETSSFSKLLKQTVCIMVSDFFYYNYGDKRCPVYTDVKLKQEVF